MVEEHSERRKTKAYARNSNLRHSISSTTRLSKHKQTQGFARGHSTTDLASEGAEPPRFSRNNSRHNVWQKQKKAVIQLERSDSDENEDFTDVSDAEGQGDDSKSASGTESRESPGVGTIPAPRLHPSEPMISNETVVSLSDVTGARTRQRLASGSFVQESDFVSAAVIGDDDDLRSIFGEQSSRTVGNLTRQKGRREPSGQRPPRTERDRVNERVFKQYFNITNIHNPVIESIHRVQQLNMDRLSLVPNGHRSHLPPIASPLADRQVHDLTATTTSQLDDSDPGDTTYLLTKLWQEGWIDPNGTPKDTPEQTPEASRHNSSSNIGVKARWAAQRLSNGNIPRDRGIKLA